MMLPARACSPPNFFTPRRLLSLSRPLRDEPPAFLCAMLDYFFGDFLAAPLAGAAFSVDPVSALALAGAGFFAAALGAPAAFSSFGAGLAVGVPATSLEACCALVAAAVSFACAAGDLPASALGDGSALAAAFLLSLC